MVQVNGIARLLTQRLSRDFDGSVKYSTLWPSRMDSPSAASRAMPTRPVFGGGEIEGRKDIRRFAFYSPMVALTRPVRQASSEVNVVWKRGGEHHFNRPYTSTSLRVPK